MLKDTIIPSTELHKRASDILGAVSFGLEIVAIDVAIVMQQGPMGLRPVWMIVYQAKGSLLGSENNVTQGTMVDDPFLAEPVLRRALEAGCESLRKARASQLNGKAK